MYIQQGITEYKNTQKCIKKYAQCRNNHLSPQLRCDLLMKKNIPIKSEKGLNHFTPLSPSNTHT